MDRLAALEAASGGRLGVAALDCASGAAIAHRAGERFPFCSTFKVLLAAAVVEAGLGDERVAIAAEDLLPHSPVTGSRVGRAVAARELCAAAVEQSDNAAANLLLRRLGGPAALTAYARSIGDSDFRLDRWEPDLNSAIPGDPRDTTTPAAMARDLRRLAHCAPLMAWMRGCATGAGRIRAAVPAGWTVADKTGTGSHGTTNDVGVVWPPGQAPLALAIYFTQAEPDAPPREDVVAAAAQIAVEALAGRATPTAQT